MLMTGQPQPVHGASGEVRLQQSAGTAVFRVSFAVRVFVFFLPRRLGHFVYFLFLVYFLLFIFS